MPAFALDGGVVLFLALVLANVAIAVFARRVRSRIRWRNPVHRSLAVRPHHQETT